MSYIIYTQQYAGQCGSYACLNALQRMGVDISEATILSYGAMWGFPDMERTLTSRGYITGISAELVSPVRIDNYLKKGHKLVCKIYRNNFKSLWYPPYVQDFKGIMGHFVCIVADLGDRWKYVDQQGEKLGDKGYGYIMKKDIKNIEVRCLYLR